MEKTGTVWTIGHSNQSWDAFVKTLQAFDIALLADIRSFPTSQRHPHFNGSAMKPALREVGISYIHLQALGGRRTPVAASVHTALREPAFRGYADQMETPAFLNAIVQLETLALQQRTALMCAEADWRHCHRALLSDLLKLRGWEVRHLAGSTEGVHTYTPAARIINGRLRYSDPGLFDQAF